MYTIPSSDVRRDRDGLPTRAQHVLTATALSHLLETRRKENFSRFSSRTRTTKPCVMRTRRVRVRAQKRAERIYSSLCSVRGLKGTPGTSKTRKFRP